MACQYSWSANIGLAREIFNDKDRNNDTILKTMDDERRDILSLLSDGPPFCPKDCISEKILQRAVEPMLAQDPATEICEDNRRTSHELTRRIKRRNVRTGVTERVRPGNGTGNYTYPRVPAL